MNHMLSLSQTSFRQMSTTPRPKKVKKSFKEMSAITPKKTVVTKVAEVAAKVETKVIVEKSAPIVEAVIEKPKPKGKCPVTAMKNLGGSVKAFWKRNRFIRGYSKLLVAGLVLDTFVFSDQ